MLDLQSKLNLLNSDPNFAVYLLTGPQPEDQFLSQQLGRDYQRYMEMRRDPHIRSQLQKRRQAILGRNMLVETKSKKRADLAAAATAQAILDKLPYERLCSSLLNSGQLIGFSVLQIDFNRVDALVLPQTTFIPQNRFVFANYPLRRWCNLRSTHRDCDGGWL
jgi:phage gp29-like protein